MTSLGSYEVLHTGPRLFVVRDTRDGAITRETFHSKTRAYTAAGLYAHKEKLGYPRPNDKFTQSDDIVPYEQS